MSNPIIKSFLLITTALLFSFSAEGQKGFSLKVVRTDSTTFTSPDLKKIYDGSKSYRDTFQLYRQIESILMQFRSEGFLSAGIDSVKKEGTIYSAFLFCGQKYLWGEISQGNVPAELLQGTGYRKKLFSKKPFRFEQIATINEKILRNSENNGYPFAVLTLDSIHLITQ